MSRTIMAVLVILTIVGSFAAPHKDHKDKKEHKMGHKDHKEGHGHGHGHGRGDHHNKGGHHMDLELTSCVKAETIQNMRNEFLACEAMMANVSTTTTTTTEASADENKEGDHKHHGHCDGKRRMIFGCMAQKIRQMIIDAKPASSVDAIEFIARNNLTEEAQQAFINATTSCFTKEDIKIQELTTKQDASMEDWKPVIHCLRHGMHKSCKEKVAPSTTASSSSETADASSTTAASETSVDIENDDDDE